MDTYISSTIASGSRAVLPQTFGLDALILSHTAPPRSKWSSKWLLRCAEESISTPVWGQAKVVYLSTPRKRVCHASLWRPKWAPWSSTSHDGLDAEIPSSLLDISRRLTKVSHVCALLLLRCLSVRLYVTRTT